MPKGLFTRRRDRIFEEIAISGEVISKKLTMTSIPAKPEASGLKMKTIAASIFAMLAVTTVARAEQFRPDPASVRFIEVLVENDRQTVLSGGRGMFQYPPGATEADARVRADAWLYGQDKDALTDDPEKRQSLFLLYLAAAHLPRDSTCFHGEAGDSCESDMKSAVLSAQKSPGYAAAFASAGGTLGFAPLGEQARAGSAPLPRPVLRLPDPHDLQNALTQCDDAGFSTGDKRIAEACRRATLASEAKLETMQRDPTIPEPLWYACWQATVIGDSMHYGLMAKCAAFVKMSCSKAATQTDADMKRCLRAVASDGWMLNSQIDPGKKIDN